MQLKFYASSVHLSIDSRPIEYMWIIKVLFEYHVEFTFSQISFTTEDNTGRLVVLYDTDRYPYTRGT